MKIFVDDGDTSSGSLVYINRNHKIWLQSDYGEDKYVYWTIKCGDVTIPYYSYDYDLNFYIDTTFADFPVTDSASCTITAQVYDLTVFSVRPIKSLTTTITLLIDKFYITSKGTYLRDEFDKLFYAYPDSLTTSSIDSYFQGDGSYNYSYIHPSTYHTFLDGWNKEVTLDFSTFGYTIPNGNKIKGIKTGTKPQFNLIQSVGGQTGRPSTYPFAFIHKNSNGNFNIRYIKINDDGVSLSFLDRSIDKFNDGSIFPECFILILQGAGGGGGGHHHGPLAQIWYGGDGGGSGSTWGGILTTSNMTTNSGYFVVLSVGGDGAGKSDGNKGKAGGNCTLYSVTSDAGRYISGTSITYSQFESFTSALANSDFLVMTYGGGTSDNIHVGKGGSAPTVFDNNGTLLIKEIVNNSGFDGGAAGDAKADISSGTTKYNPGGDGKGPSYNLYCTNNPGFYNGLNVLESSKFIGGTGGKTLTPGGGGGASYFSSGGNGGSGSAGKDGKFGSGGGGAARNYVGGKGGDGALFIYY